MKKVEVGRQEKKKLQHFNGEERDEVTLHGSYWRLMIWAWNF